MSDELTFEQFMALSNPDRNPSLRQRAIAAAAEAKRIEEAQKESDWEELKEEIPRVLTNVLDLTYEEACCVEVLPRTDALSTPEVRFRYQEIMFKLAWVKTNGEREARLSYLKTGNQAYFVADLAMLGRQLG